jgi:hypothetical protein
VHPFRRAQHIAQAAHAVLVGIVLYDLQVEPELPGGVADQLITIPALGDHTMRVTAVQRISPDRTETETTDKARMLVLDRFGMRPAIGGGAAAFVAAIPFVSVSGEVVLTVFARPAARWGRAIGRFAPLLAINFLAVMLAISRL